MRLKLEKFAPFVGPIGLPVRPICLLAIRQVADCWLRKIVRKLQRLRRLQRLRKLQVQLSKLRLRASSLSSPKLSLISKNNHHNFTRPPALESQRVAREMRQTRRAQRKTNPAHNWQCTNCNTTTLHVMQTAPKEHTIFAPSRSHLIRPRLKFTLSTLHAYKIHAYLEFNVNLHASTKSRQPANSCHQGRGSICSPKPCDSSDALAGVHQFWHHPRVC